MRLTTYTGIFLAIATLVSAAISDYLGLQFANIMLGVAIGGALGRYALASPLARVGSFFVGFVLAWISYGVRAAVMPADSMSIAIVAAGLFLVLTVIAFFTKNKVNLAAMILGVAAVSGAYEAAYLAAPYLFVSQSTASAASILVPVSLGWLAVSLAQIITKEIDHTANVAGYNPLTGEDSTSKTKESVPTENKESGLSILNKEGAE